MSENLTAWSQGYLACQRGEGVMSNPYAREATWIRRAEWQGGWNHADDQARKIKARLEKEQQP